MKALGLVAAAALVLVASAAAGSNISKAGLTGPPVPAGTLVNADRPGAPSPRHTGGSLGLGSDLQSVATAAQQSVAAGVAQADALSLPRRGNEIRVVVPAVTASDGFAAAHGSGGVVEATSGSAV